MCRFLGRVQVTLRRVAVSLVDSPSVLLGTLPSTLLELTRAPLGLRTSGCPSEAKSVLLPLTLLSSVPTSKPPAALSGDPSYAQAVCQTTAKRLNWKVQEIEDSHR